MIVLCVCEENSTMDGKKTRETHWAYRGITDEEDDKEWTGWFTSNYRPFRHMFPQETKGAKNVHEQSQ